MATRLVLLTILGIGACSTPPVETKPAQAVSLLFYQCIQTHCIDSAPGAQANAEDPVVKQEFFDRCLKASQAQLGSSEHATEMDKCMAKFGYFRNAIIDNENNEVPRQ